MAEEKRLRAVRVSISEVVEYLRDFWGSTSERVVHGKEKEEWRDEGCGGRSTHREGLTKMILV